MTAIAKILLSVLLVSTFSAAAGNNIYLPIILNQPTPHPNRSTDQHNFTA